MSFGCVYSRRLILSRASSPYTPTWARLWALGAALGSWRSFGLLAQLWALGAALGSWRSFGALMQLRALGSNYVIKFVNETIPDELCDLHTRLARISPSKLLFMYTTSHPMPLCLPGSRQDQAYRDLTPMLADLASRRPDTSPPESSPYKSQKPLKVLPEERPNYKICLAFVSKAADSPPKNIVDGAALAIAKAPRALRDLQDGPWNLPPHLFLSEFGIKRLMSKSFGKNLVRLSNEEPNYNTALGTLGQTARERRKAPRRKRSIRWKPSDIAKTIDEIRKRRSKCR